MIERNKIYQGDCIQTLKTFPDESIDCVVTSPPYYGLRDYGTADWEGGDVNCIHEVDDTNKNICKKCKAKKIDKQIGIEETYQKYIENLLILFDEIKRVLKKEGTCWVNLGDTYNNNSVGGGNSCTTGNKKALE